MTCGIYVIKNRITGEQYVGSSKNIEKRWQSHLQSLRSNRHDNRYLQDIWNKSGEDNIEFRIVEQCEPSERMNLEQEYIDSGKFVLNIATRTGHPRFTKPDPLEEEIREFQVATMERLRKKYAPDLIRFLTTTDKGGDSPELAEHKRRMLSRIADIVIASRTLREKST